MPETKQTTKNKGSKSTSKKKAPSLPVENTVAVEFTQEEAIAFGEICHKAVQQAGIADNGITAENAVHLSKKIGLITR